MDIVGYYIILLNENKGKGIFKFQSQPPEIKSPANKQRLICRITTTVVDIGLLLQLLLLIY